ncbi:hypothetical protein [Megasphaera vaginalis (ex Bordigoni et al. 2020)]|uniref:hypothetical protein n=1 Tax=Megasphaera vaginalis (ex Bordigoni et al. 2020) TaxID=2045301 RepID=UPI000C7BE3D2|nr:hypothetical protein [Megasphaera vaginalis (ex Bordigoni et al. 2020)]
MISESYAATLKRLITFTQTKFISLADIVGYDISYVSKWSNGTKLPSSKYVERINEEMGHYFADIIISKKKEEAFYKSFPITPNPENLGFEIGQYLCAAYRATVRQKSTPKNKETKSAVRVITGFHDTATFITDALQKGIQSLEGDGELLIFGEFCNLFDAGFWKNFNNINLGMSNLAVHVGLDLERLEKNPAYITHIYTILNRFLDIDFSFYDAKDIQNTNLIILKDIFVIQYAMTTPARFNMCTYIYDEAMVRDIYEKFSFNANEKKRLLFPVNSLGMDELGFRSSFYATNRFFWFLTNGFDFLLPHAVFENIMQSVPPEQAFSVTRLCVMWEEILGKSEMDFIVPATSLIRYLESGYIYLTDIEYNLTVDERKQHFKTVTDTMNKNSAITMGTLLSSPETSSYCGGNLSFYSNYSTGFLKKNRQYIRNKAKAFYMIVDERFHAILLNSFQSLKALPQYQQYSADELTEKYELYKPLIERTLLLKKG